MRLLATFAAARRRLLFVCLLSSAGALTAQNPQTTGWVVIPVAEYGALRGKAFPLPRTTDGVPVDATLTRVDYDLRAGGDVASGRATLTVDVLKEGWVRVPIPRGLMVREARIEDKLVSLVNGNNTLTAVLTRRGRSVMQLQIALPVASNGGEERLALPATASGVTRAAVRMARADLDVKVSGGLLTERTEAEGEARWLAFGHGNEPLAFTWRRRMEEQKRAPLPLRMRGSLAQLIALGEDNNSPISAEVGVEVAQGAARSIRIAVPPTVAVNTIAGSNVADWEVKAGELTVSFLDPVEAKAAFVIQAETQSPRDGAIELPLLRLLDCERESGGVAVEVLGAGEIRNLRSQGLERTEAADLGAAIASRQSPSLVAFRYRTGAGARSLGVDVTRYTQQAVLTANIEEARYRVLIAGDGKMLVEARYAVRNNQRNFVRISLPEGATLWSASLGGRPAQPGHGPDGSLLFPLAKSRAGEDAPVFPVEILYLSPGAAWAEKGRAMLTLPALDLPVSRTGIALYHPPNHRVLAEAGSFHAQAFAPPTSPALIGNAMPGEPPVPRSDTSAAQALVDRYRTRREAHAPAVTAPLHVAFPAVGPSVFLAGELTAENQATRIQLTYEKGGTR